MQGRRKRQHESIPPAEAGAVDVHAPQEATGPVGQDTSSPAEPPRDSASASKKEKKANSGKNAAGGSRFGELFAIRNWRIRTRITALLLLPVVVAALLGGLRIQASIDTADEMERVNEASNVLDAAAALSKALSNEREFSAAPGVVGKLNSADVHAARRLTDQMAKEYAAAVSKIDTRELPVLEKTLATAKSSVTLLDNARKGAYDNKNVKKTIDAYGAIIEDLLAVYQEAPELTRDPELIQGARALSAYGLMYSAASAQRAALMAYSARPEEPFADSYEMLKTANDKEAELSKQFDELAPDKWRTEFKRGVSADKTTAVEQIMIIAQGAVAPTDSDSNTTKPLGKGTIDARAWWKVTETKLTALNTVHASLGKQLHALADDLRAEARRNAIRDSVLIVVALLITILLGVFVARSLVKSLNRLRRGALEIAEETLPATVRRLAEVDPADVDLEIQPIPVTSKDEVGQVARAFDAVHGEAVRLAAEQALLRGNVNSMFTNLSRRSQSLIQRQLALISDLENREADPDQLANLFKLDHLATRMRRNGENLLVLAGEEPGRRWTRPVPLVDVLRAAASEVEQYERVELGALPTTDLAGRAVNDAVHLLAELLENATTFSSPHTKVRVTGHILPDGRALVEIHDSGIGLTGDDLADANQRLARPPVVDVSISRRMGLFVVGRLATRHGIRVQLRPGEGGGTTALVMLPIELIQGERGGAAEGWGEGGKGQRPAAVTPVPEKERLEARPAAQALPAPRNGAGTGRRGLPAGAPGSAPDMFQRPEPQAPQQSRQQPPQQAPQPERAADGQLPRRDQGATTGGPGRPEATSPGIARQPQFGTPYDGTPAYDRPSAYETGSYEQVPQQPQHQAPQQPGPYDTGSYEAVQETGSYDARAFQQPQQGRPAQQQPPAYGQPPYPVAPAVPDNPFAPVGPPAPQPSPQRGGPEETREFPGGLFRDEPSQELQQPADDGRYEHARPDERRPGTGAWATPEFDRLSPVQPQAFGVPPQRGPEPQRTDPQWSGPEHGRPAQGESLPALRDPRRPAQDQPQEQPRQQQPQTPRQGQQQRPRPELPAAPQPAEEPVAPAAWQPPQQPAPQQESWTTPADGVSALDAETVVEYGEDEGSPIFDTLNSDWFHRRTGRGGRMRAAQVRSNQDDEGPSTGEFPAVDKSGPQRVRGRAAESAPQPENLQPQQPQQPDAFAPRPQQARQQPGPFEQQAPLRSEPQHNVPDEGASGWYSAGDEGWRAAESAQQPVEGGTTGAGLPRRVPRANLVPGGVGETTGGAQAPAGPPAPTPQGGAVAPQAPSLSRSPDDVRGRLTNFRRGIQQGRTAGTGGSAPGSRDENNQQEQA